MSGFVLSLVFDFDFDSHFEFDFNFLPLIVNVCSGLWMSIVDFHLCLWLSATDLLLPLTLTKSTTIYHSFHMKSDKNSFV